MSTTLTLERARTREMGEDIEWVEAEIGDIASAMPPSPVTVKADLLEIESALLEVGKVYNFDYLDAKMVLWKLPDGTVELYQVVE